jgi:hypothetical protein
LKLREERQGDTSTVDGNTNYVITRIVAGAFGPNPGEKWRYWMIARAMGCFICAALEFYRRVGARREDEVIADNGDIPEYSENQS